MSFANLVCGAVVIVSVMITPTIAFGQSIGPNVGQSVSVNSPHRPWVGFTLGTGFLGGNSVEPDDSRDLGLSVDIPLQPSARIRVGTGRMWVHGGSTNFREFPLRRLTVDAVALIPFTGRGRACQSNVVVGGGAGLYHYGLGNGFSATRPGYQLFAGAECVGNRISAGLEFTGRSIRGPANMRLPDTKLFALAMHFTFKIRL